jgi:hypothetical protein
MSKEQNFTFKVFKLKQGFENIEFTERDVLIYRILKGLKSDEQFMLLNTDGTIKIAEGL